MIDYRSFCRNITSQNGEDGIIQAILERLDIGSGWCVEFGAWDGEHLSNTWNLWHDLGWCAVLIEGDPDKAKDLKEKVGCFDCVTALCSFVSHTGKNQLDSLLNLTNVPCDFELLSIDVDGDDWHIWSSLTKYQPKIVICEFSMWFPYDLRFLNAPGNKNLGCSARTLVELGLSKGYELVCCNNVNAIFVRSDLIGKLKLAGTSQERLASTQECFDLKYLSVDIFNQIAVAWTNAEDHNQLERFSVAWLTRLQAIESNNLHLISDCRAVILNCPSLNFAYDMLFATFESIGYKNFRKKML